MKIPRSRLLLYSLVAATVITGALLLLGRLDTGLPLVLDIAVLGAAAATLVYLAAAVIAHRARMRGPSGS